jgi:hypothetical protein
MVYKQRSREVTGNNKVKLHLAAINREEYSTKNEINGFWGPLLAVRASPLGM